MTSVSGARTPMPPEIMSQVFSLTLLEEPERNLFDPLREVKAPSYQEAGQGRLFVNLSDYTSKLRNASFVSESGTSLITNQPIGVSLVRPPEHFSPLTLGLFFAVNPA
jgi:hypothetical protein